MIWTCNRGHSVLEGQPRVCPWCRIDALEKALRDVRGEIESQSGLKDFYQDWSHALAKINTSLMESRPNDAR